MADIGLSFNVTANTGESARNIKELSELIVRFMNYGTMAMRDSAAAVSDSQNKREQAVRNAEELETHYKKTVEDIIAVYVRREQTEGKYLTKWQRDLNYRIDELGRLRTENGRFVDGLTTLQRKLGFSVDEAGNIYNKANEIVGTLGKSTKQATPGLDDIDSYLKKIARNTLTAADAFDKLKKGLDVFLGEGNALSRFVDKTGDVAHATTALIQLREQYQQIKGQLAALPKYAKGAQLALAALGAEAAAATAGFALLGALIVATYKHDEKIKRETLDSLDPALKGLDSYKEKYKEIEDAARRAGAEIKNLGDALKFGAFGGKNGGGNMSDVETLLDALKENEASGLSSQQRALAGAGLGVLPKWLGGEHLDRATLRIMDALGSDGGAGKTSQEEREEIFGALNDYVAQLNEQISDENKEAAALRQHVVNLEGIIAALPEGDAQRQELEQLAGKLRERESEILIAEARAKAGVDKYLNAEDAAVVSIENYREKIDEWRGLIADGALTTEQFAEAEKNVTSTLKDALLGSLGIKLPAAVDATTEASDKLKKAMEAGVLTSDEYAAASSQLTSKVRDELLAKLGVALPSQVDATAEALRQLADASDAGALSSEEYAEAVRQVQEKTVAQLAASAGLSLEKETTTPSLAEFTKQLDEAREKEKINAEQYAALLQAYRDNAAKVLQSQQDAAASALAASQGLDLDAVEKARRAAMTLEEQRGEWERLLAEQKISQDAYNKAMGALNLAIDARTKAEQEAAEKTAAEAREKALQDTGINALRQQAAELENGTRTWREELEETMKNARKAYEAGTIGLADLQQARKDYSAVLKAKSKEEKIAARSSVRQALGVDSLMESLKSPAQKLNETLAQLNDAFHASHVNSDEYAALRSKAFDEYRSALSDFQEKQDAATEKSERVAAGASLSDSRDFYKAVVNQMTPRSYEKQLEDNTARMASRADDTYRATLESNEYLARIAANAAPAFEVFG